MNSASWQCPKCHERIDDGFVVCWVCGTDQKGKLDPGFPSQADPDPVDSTDPTGSSCQFSLATLLIVVSTVAILLGALRVFPAITHLVIVGGIVGNLVGLGLALFVTYVLRIPNDGSLSWNPEEQADDEAP